MRFPGSRHKVNRGALAMTEHPPLSNAGIRPWRWSSAWSIRLMRAGVAVVAVCLWELIARGGIGNPAIVSSPTAVWEAFATMMSEGILWKNLVATMTAAVIALTLAGLTGMVAGLWLALTPTVEQVLEPYLSAVNSMPRIALAPVFIILFGISMGAKVALAFSLVFFIVLSSARAGVHAADPDVLRLMSAMGASRAQFFWKVYLPAAFPSIMSGLRLGVIYSLLGVVGQELIASRDGIGQVISLASGTYDLATVYACLLCLAALATVLNSAMRYVETKAIKWQTVASNA